MELGTLLLSGIDLRTSLRLVDQEQAKDKDCLKKPDAKATSFYELESFFELKTPINNLGKGSFDGRLKVQIQAARPGVRELIFVTTYGINAPKQLPNYAKWTTF